MEETKDLYDILDVDRNASEEEIKSAYRLKSKLTHPDVNNGNDEGFKAVNEAYKVLSDPAKRAQYDRTGSIKAEKTEQQLRAQAIGEIQGMLVQLLDSSDDSIFFTDFPAKVHQIISLNIAESKKAMSKSKTRIARLRRFKKKFKSTTVIEKMKDDFVHSEFNRQIFYERTSIHGEIEKIRLFKMMLTLLAEYEYAVEEVPKTFGLATTA